MAPEDVEKAAFAAPSGLYEFLFAYCNAPATFQWLMESVLVGLTREACVVYLDNVMVMGATLEEHTTKLARILDRLRQAGLWLKPCKCHFTQKKVAMW